MFKTPAHTVTHWQAQRKEILFFNFYMQYIAVESVAQNLHPEFTNVQV